MIFNIPIFQLAGIAGSLLLIALLADLVRRKKLSENYSLLWFAIAIIFLLFSLSKALLVALASLLGIDYPPAALFLILIMALYFLALHFSLVISGLSKKNKALAQEIGLLQEQVKELKK